MYADYEKLWQDYNSDIKIYDDALLPKLTKTDVAVDVGAGNGRLTRWLGQTFDRVVTVDPNYSTDHKDLRDYKGSADLVLFGFNTLNYVLDRKEAEALVKHATQICPDGWLVFDMAGYYEEDVIKRGVRWVRKYNPANGLIHTEIGKAITVRKYYHKEFLLDLVGDFATIIHKREGGYYLLKNMSYKKGWVRYGFR